MFLVFKFVLFFLFADIDIYARDILVQNVACREIPFCINGKVKEARDGAYAKSAFNSEE